MHGTVTIGRGLVGPWSTRLHERGPDSMLGIESPHLPDGYLFGRAPGDYPRWEGADRVLTGDLGAQLDGHLYCLAGRGAGSSGAPASSTSTRSTRRCANATA